MLGAWVEEDQRKYFEKFITTIKDNAFIIMDRDKKIGFYNGKFQKTEIMKLEIFVLFLNIKEKVLEQKYLEKNLMKTIIEILKFNTSNKILYDHYMLDQNLFQMAKLNFTIN